ncbi:NYN domain-containing protein [bacterium]|nr:NYN domain-containing protein [bacterium]
MMIAFLIDADNFSAPAWIEEAFQTIERTEGSIAIRRAYGSAENLKGLADTLRAWAIRPFVNLPLPKNTTDMSLAVDAMELACLTPRPKMIVIGSGDLDFVPLVVRLRERGIRVLCVTERSKMAQDAVRAYDEVIYVGSDQPVRLKAESSAPVTPVPAVPKKAVSKPATAKPKAPKPPAVKAAPVKKVAAKTNGTQPSAVTVAKILAVVPGLGTSEWQTLGKVAKVLHDEKLLAKSATTPTLFKKFPDNFELDPAGKPNRVRFIR